jgi:hypothetical protein
MKVAIFRGRVWAVLVAMLLGVFAITGCNSETKLNTLIAQISQVAPEGKENAVDGYKLFTIKHLGKYRLEYTGVYKEGGILYAASFTVEGMMTRYEARPFAWKLKTTTE